MNALAIPQPMNITPLHPRMCAHCQQRPVYAPKAIYCGKSCTDKAYRARKREKTATIAREQSQTHRVEQLIAIVERQAEQIAALTAAIQQQPPVTWRAATEQPPPHNTNVQPQATASADDLLPMKKAAPSADSGKNLLLQLLEATQTDYTATKKPKPATPHLVNSNPKKIAAAQPLAAPSADDIAAQISF